MQNVNPSSPTSPKGPQELPPESIAAKQGWKRAVDTGESKTTSRTREPKGKEPIEDKSIADRSVATKEVPQKQPTDVEDLGTYKDQPLLDDVLHLIAKSSSITDFAEFSKVSKTLNKLSKETDLEKLKEFREKHQLSFKEDVALSILLLAAQTASKPAVGDITGSVEVDLSLTPEEALSQLTTLENNYKQIQTAYNDFLQSTINLLRSPNFEQQAAIAVIAITWLSYTSTLEPMSAAINVLVSTTLIGRAFNLISQSWELAAFRIAATNTMTTLTQNLVSPSSPAPSSGIL